MAQSIDISDQEMTFVREEAELSSRSIAGQVAHWMRIGRAIERAPGFSYDHIRNASAGQLSPDDPSGEEQAVFVDELLNEVGSETAEQKAFFEGRRAVGIGVGLDHSETAVRQKKPGQA